MPTSVPHPLPTASAHEVRGCRTHPCFHEALAGPGFTNITSISLQRQTMSIPRHRPAGHHRQTRVRWYSTAQAKPAWGTHHSHVQGLTAAVSGSMHLHTAELSRSLGHARPGPLSSARHGCLHCRWQEHRAGPGRGSSLIPPPHGQQAGRLEGFWELERRDGLDRSQSRQQSRRRELAALTGNLASPIWKRSLSQVAGLACCCAGLTAFGVFDGPPAL